MIDVDIKSMKDKIDNTIKVGVYLNAWQLGILNLASPLTAAGPDRPTSHTHGALPLSIPCLFSFSGFPTLFDPLGSLSFVWLCLFRSRISIQGATGY